MGPRRSDVPLAGIDSWRAVIGPPESNAPEQPRVVLAGAAGFIGSHLLRKLIGLGALVLGIDNLSTGRMENVSWVPADAHVRLLVGDVADRKYLAEVRSFSPHIVIHLAAIHYIPYCMAHPAETFCVNVHGTHALLASLLSLPVRAVVVASSAAVYGFSDTPLSEHAPVHPEHVYGLSKYLAEEALHAFHGRRPDVRCVAARLFNVYGRNDGNAHVVPHLLAAARSGGPVPVGLLWPRRDFVYVEDVADALIRMCRGPAEDAVFNVGTGTGTSVLELIRAIEHLTGTHLEPRQDASRFRENEGHLVSDITSIRDRLGWTPQVDLRRGLRALVRAPASAA